MGRTGWLASAPAPLTGGFSGDALRTPVGRAEPMHCRTRWCSAVPARRPTRRARASSSARCRRGLPGAAGRAPRHHRSEPVRRGPSSSWRRCPAQPLFADGGPVATFQAFRRVPGVLAALMAELHARRHATGDACAGGRRRVRRWHARNGLAARRRRLADRRRGWSRDAPNGPRIRSSATAICTRSTCSTTAWSVRGRRLGAGDDRRPRVRRRSDRARCSRAVPVEMPDRVRSIVQRFGRRSADQFVRAYAAHRQLDRIVGGLARGAARRPHRIRLARRDPSDRADLVLDVWAPTAPFLEARVRELTGPRVVAPLHRCDV